MSIDANPYTLFLILILLVLGTSEEVEARMRLMGRKRIKGKWFWVKRKARIRKVYRMGSYKLGRRPLSARINKD